MTDYVWVGTTSTSASTNTNWIPLGVPAVGDTVTFNATSTQKCEWDIALPATAFSVDEVILDDDFSYSLELDVTIRTKALYVGGGTLAAGADGNMKFEHGSSPNEFGSQKSFDERFIMIGDGGTIEQNVVFTIGGTVSVDTYFDDGSYPTVILTSGTFSPQYKTPTGTSGKVSFYDWQIPSASSPTFAPTGDLTDNDRLKVFAPTTFTWSINTMNFGLATVEFLGTSGGIQLPIKGASGYGTDFLGIYRKVVIKANTAGHRVVMSDNTFLSVEEFEVQDGALFKGAVDDTSQGCEIHCISKPKINGTWSFSQITEGIYRSPRHSQGAMGYVGGDFRITGKLTVDGLIDPTGLELTPQASNPSNANTLWLNSGDSNKLYHGSSEVGGGGGGSGTVTSVGFSVPTGFTISGSPITTSGTLGLAFDTGYALPTSAKQTQWDTAYGWGDHSTQGYLTSAPPETDPIFSASQAASITNAGSGSVITSAERTKLSGIETNADVTDTANVTAAGALMDSEVTNLADVKSFDPADYAPSSPEVCVVNLATSVSNFTPTGAYTLLQRTGNWASTNPNFNTATGLYTVATDGIYRISWSNSFRFTPVGQLQASRIYVNGNPAAQGTTSSSGAWPIGSASVLLTLSTGDTVGLYVYISTTGTTLVGDNLVPFSNHMSINKVSN